MNWTDLINWKIAKIIVTTLAPAVAGLFVVPIMLAETGAEGLGAYLLAYSAINLAGVFELGVGRAETKCLSELKKGSESERKKGVIVGSALVGSLLGGLLGGGIYLLLGSILLFYWERNLSVALQMLLGLSVVFVPMITVPYAIRGYLEASGRMVLSSILKSALGLLCYGLIIVLYILDALDHETATQSLGWAIATAFVIHLSAFCIVYRLEGKLSLLRATYEDTIGLMKYGWWIFSTGLIGSIYPVYDRYLVGSIAGAASVAYFAVPYDLVSRLVIFPQAVAVVFFPTYARNKKGSGDDSVRHSQQFMVVGLGFFIAVFLLGEYLLQIWVGDRFATIASGILVMLAASMTFASASQMLLAYLQASGRAGQVAFLQALELIAYLPMSYTLITAAGPSGAAAAVVFRFFVDWACLRLLVNFDLREQGVR